MTTYTPAQLAKRLQVSRSKVMCWIRGGKLCAVNVGEGGSTRYRITSDALADFLDSRRVQPAVKREANRRITERTTKDYFPDLK